MKKVTALLAAGALVACRAPAHAQCPGDLVPDGRVDGLDLGVMLAYWGPTTALELSLAADLNQDTVVDGADLGILLSRWGFCRPVVTSVSPLSGCYLGGTTITVTGSLLAQVSAVTVGGVPCTGVVPLSSTSVRAVTPPGTIGPAAVQVTTPGGTATAPSAFAYATSEVTGISPIAGPPSGGTPVVISGRLLSGTTAVTFGGVPATDVVNVSDTQVRAVAPPGQLGTVDVALSGPKGTATLAGGFIYRDGPPPLPACADAMEVTVGTTPFATDGGPNGQVVTSNAAATTTTTIWGPQWFKFTPTVTGHYEISLCGSGGDTKIAIGIDCPSTDGGPMTSLGYNDDSCPCAYGCGSAGNLSWSSRLDLGNAGLPLGTPLVAGTSYRILVGGYGITTGPVYGDMVITQIASPPPQGPCTNPLEATVGTNTIALDPNGTALPVDCSFNGNMLNKPGYARFVPPATGTYSADTCLASVDTIMAAMTACGDAITVFACNDDDCGLRSRVTFDAIQGQAVFIAVGMWSATAAPPPQGIGVLIEFIAPP